MQISSNVALIGMKASLSAVFNWIARSPQIILIAADLIALVFSFVLSAALREILFPTPQTISYGYLANLTKAFTERSDILLFMLVIFILFNCTTGLYNRFTTVLQITRMLLVGFILMALFDGFIHYAMKIHTSRFVFVIFWASSALFVISLRLILIHILRKTGGWKFRAILCGDADMMSVLRAQLAIDHLSGIIVDSTIALDPQRTLAQNKMRIMAQLETFWRDHAVIIAPTEKDVDIAIALCQELAEAKRCHYYVPPHSTLLQSNFEIEPRFGCDFLLLRNVPKYRYRHGEWLIPGAKRCFDLIAALVSITLLMPLFALIAYHVKRDGGPAFYRQTRIGLHGARFRIFKFRSMKPDSERILNDLLEHNPPLFKHWKTHQKIDNDPRLTTIGRLMRRTSLDELPQLFNIILGDMSLVGPRPIIAPEIPNYPNDRAYSQREEITDYKKMRPGLTGAWQIGGRSSLCYEERIRLDLWYYRNLSFLTDMIIIFQTILFLLRRGHAL